MCDDGVLRNVKAVFGKYKINLTTKNALNNIINILGNTILNISTSFMTVL